MYTAVLDDDIEYLIVETLELDGTLYTLFSELENDMNFCFRKTILKDGKEYYSCLEDRNEFNKVMLAFSKKLTELNLN